MAWSERLGMRVFDPQEGARLGMQAGQLFARAYQGAQDRQLDERKLAIMEEEVAEKARLTLRRNMGVAQMQQKAEQLVAQGIDPDVARRTAFLDAAPLLFGGTEQGLATWQRLQSSEEANEVRRQAAEMLDRRQREIAETRAQLERENQGIKLEGILAREEANRTKEELERLKEAGRDRRHEETITARDKANREDNAARDALQSKKDASVDRRFQQSAMLRAAGDEQLKKIDQLLTKYRERLSKQSYAGNPLMTEKGTRESIAELEKQRAQRLEELGVEPKEKPALRVGAIVEQNGKRYRYEADGTFTEIK